jgi:hypothetical protein
MDIDFPTNPRVNEVTRVYHFEVIQAMVEFNGVVTVNIDMDNGRFDPCELVVDRAIMGSVESNNKDAPLTKLTIEGDWFEVSILCGSIECIEYAPAKPSDRPWLPPGSRMPLPSQV